MGCTLCKAGYWECDGEGGEGQCEPGHGHGGPKTDPGSGGPKPPRGRQWQINTVVDLPDADGKPFKIRVQAYAYPHVVSENPLEVKFWPKVRISPAVD